MKPPTSTRLLLTIPFAIPAYWTPEQALAVFELLEDLRDAVWNHYSMQLFDEAREQYAACSATEQSDNPSDDPEDRPF
jgi:hypothetical protein